MSCKAGVEELAGRTTPGLAILFTTLAFNTSGKSLRVALDPTMKRR